MDIAACRLAAQFIGGGSKTPLELVRYMGAMQAQDYYGALWAIGLRTGLSQNQVIKSIEKIQILRTWPQRGTLHFVPSQDAKWLVSLSAEQLKKRAASRHRQLDLDDKIFTKSRQILSKTMKGGRLIPRPEVMQILEQSGINTKEGRGYHIVWYLSQTGVTFIGPMAGKQQTFGLLDEWTKPVKMDRQQGTSEVAKRYFTSHGPATLNDFMWWTGLTTKEARAAIEANSHLLKSEVIDGQEYWLYKKGPKPLPAPSAFLLPPFDEFLLGYKDRSAVMDPTHEKEVVFGRNGMFHSIVVINGKVVGLWRRTIKRDHVEVQFTDLVMLSKADKQLLNKPIEAYGRFLELPVKVI